LKRYYLLGTKIPRNAPDPRGATAALLDELKVPSDNYRYGVTKVFFRTGQLATIEEMREKKIGEILITIQAASRGFLARQFLKRMTEKDVAIKIIQRNIRSYIGFKNWGWWKLFNKVKPMLKRVEFDKQLKEKNEKKSKN